MVGYVALTRSHSRARFVQDAAAAIADLNLSDVEHPAFVARDLRRVNELAAATISSSRCRASPRASSCCGAG